MKCQFNTDPDSQLREAETVLDLFRSHGQLAVVARAILVGMEQAVREMRTLVKG